MRLISLLISAVIASTNASVENVDMYNDLISRYGDLSELPDHFNRSFLEDFSRKKKHYEIGACASICPCLCSYGCKWTRTHGIDVCCDQQAEQDPNCWACQYPNGNCWQCAPNYSLLGGLCVKDAACVKRNDAQCVKCSHGYILVDGLCKQVPQCVETYRSYCIKCKTGYVVTTSGNCTLIN